MRVKADSAQSPRRYSPRGTTTLALLALAVAWDNTRAQDAEEQLFWESVRCHEEMEVRAYLEEFPSGAYVDQAEQCLDKHAKQPADSKGAAWLGVMMQSVTHDLAESFGMSEPEGALIAEMVPDSPAAKSDLQPGDIIVKYDGKRLIEMPDLPSMVGATPAGETVELGIIRNGEELTVQVELGELPAEGARAAGSDETREIVLGMRLENLDSQTKREREVDHGVRVQEVLDDGPAREAGIRPGDVLLQIRGEDVQDFDQVRDLASELPAGKSVPVLVKREIRSLFLAIKVPEANEGEQTKGQESDSTRRSFEPEMVRVDDFSIGKYEVTQGQWKAIMDDNPSSFQKGGDYPVENVSWHDAQEYIAKLNASMGGNYRLPTEDEWERACHGGGPEREYCGSNDVNAVAWYDGNSNSSTHPAGRKQANRLGIYDLSGNVDEWTSTLHESGGGARVLRGGSWFNSPWKVRSAYRAGLDPGHRLIDTGFRLAHD